jgi:signal transduction histidine kinase
MKKIIPLFIFCLFNVSLVFSQSNIEKGYPLIINYSPKEYGAFQTNWTICQDKRGVMYFGNDIGLLEFDGAVWRFYQVPNKTTIRSLANGDSGKIYAGAVAELGYFMPSSSGKLIFHSLIEFLPKDKRDFSDVWQTFVNNGKVYFNTSKYILIWDAKKKEFKIIQGEENFHLIFSVNGKIYAREWGKGLEVLKSDSPTLLKGGEKFANERIYVMVPFPGEERTILIGTRTMGLLKYDGKNFIPIKTEADKFIRDSLIYFPGTILSDGNILLGTISGGAMVIDSTGKEVARYDRESGIVSNSILFTFMDMSGAIWLSTDNGISRIDYSSPASYFDSRNNFSTSPLDIIRHNGIIYAAANNGVYYLDPHTSGFHILKNSGNQSFSVLEMGNDLLVGTFDGLFKVDKNRLSPIRKTVGNEYSVQSLKLSRLNPNRIYVGTSQGLWSILKTNNGWKDEGQILNITDVVNSTIQDKDSTLWLGTNVSGVFRIIFRKDDSGNIILTKPNVEHFDKTNGLQSGYMLINKFNGVNYFTTSDSIYKFNETRKIFYSDTSDNIISSFYKIADNKSVTFFQQDSLGRLWIGTLNSLAMGMRQSNGLYKWLTAPFKRFVGEQIARVYAEKNGVIWFLGGSGLIRYDFKMKNLNNSNYRALVRRVEIGRDSTIFFGDLLSNYTAPEISYKDNSVKFNFSAANYTGKNTNRFKTFLEGFDDDWSSWSTENTKEYTNLSPGRYTFKVVANNLNDVQSKVASFSFVITPPWYRAWWAYTIYIILLGLIVFAIDRVQRSRLVGKEREKAELREAKLRADSENERRKNVELLSEIGQNITANLSIEQIIDTVYENINSLMDAAIFGIGIYQENDHTILFPGTKERGLKLKPFTNDINDDNRPAVWCFKNQKEIFTNNYVEEYYKYVKEIKAPLAGEHTHSVLYLPLTYKNKRIGVITSQSFKKDSYTQYHLNILRNLATFTAIAIDNADAYKQLNTTLDELKLMQDKLVTQEKLASLGALTAGIAHEIKNPLNFVNNFAQLSKELVTELREEYEKVKDKLGKEFIENFEDIILNIEQNVTKINEHGNRADSIVRSMLQHSRGKAGERILSDINAIIEEDLNLAYHGLRARDSSFNVSIEKDYYKNLEKVLIVPQDVSRVFLNIINNGFYEANKKKKLVGDHFSPTLKATTTDLGSKLEVRIRDNGNGIPDDVRDKIFDPFFTTKPSGEGTGLGLSLSYDIIVKEHAGEIKFDSKIGEYTEFIITLPKK